LVLADTDFDFAFLANQPLQLGDILVGTIMSPWLRGNSSSRSTRASRLPSVAPG
jgi:hypothetical protein